jgi:hypothetical protein
MMAERGLSLDHTTIYRVPSGSPPKFKRVRPVAKLFQDLVRHIGDIEDRRRFLPAAAFSFDRKAVVVRLDDLRGDLLALEAIFSAV